jgi:integrase-like protein
MEEFIEKWIQSLGPSVTEKTAVNYATLLREHAVPVIGNITLVKLGPAAFSVCMKLGVSRVPHRCRSFTSIE